MLEQSEDARTKSQEFICRSLCTALGEKEYLELRPIDRARVLDLLIHMTLDCAEFRAHVDYVEQIMLDMGKEDEERRKVKYHE